MEYKLKSADDRWQWELNYSIPTREGRLEEEDLVLKSLLNIVGDSIGLLNKLDKYDQELRKSMLQTLSIFYSDLHLNLEGSAQKMLLNHMMRQELPEELSYDHIFGGNLTEELNNVLRSEQEKDLAAETLMTLSDMYTNLDEWFEEIEDDEEDDTEWGDEEGDEDEEEEGEDNNEI